MVFSSNNKDSNWHLSTEPEKYAENHDGDIRASAIGLGREAMKLFGAFKENIQRFKGLAMFGILLGLFIGGMIIFKLVYFYLKYESYGAKRMYLKLNYKLMFTLAIISLILEFILIIVCFLMSSESELGLYGMINSVYERQYREGVFLMIFAFVLSFFIIYASKTGVKLARQYNRTGQLDGG